MKRKFRIYLFLSILLLAMILIFCVTRTEQSYTINYYHKSINGFDIYYYQGPPNAFKVQATNRSTGYFASQWAKNNIYGTNGSFFAGTDGYVQLNALHINENSVLNDSDILDQKQKIFRGGCNRVDTNKANSSMDFIYYDGNDVRVFVDDDEVNKNKPLEYRGKWSNQDTRTNRGISNIVWGVGGHNLFLMDSTISSDDTYLAALKKRYGEAIKLLNTGPAARTAIGYTADNEVVLVSVFKDPNYFDMRTIMKQLNCKESVCLDGLDLAMISYKNASKSFLEQRKSPVIIRIKEELNNKIKWNR